MDTYSLDKNTSIKGERVMSRTFIAQYAAEATLQIDGVSGLDTGILVSLKEVISGEHEGKGVKVEFGPDNSEFVTITVYPLVYYGYILPELAWSIQEKVKADVERFTGMVVDAVNVEIMGVISREEEA